MKREQIISLIRRERSVQIPTLQQKYGIPYGEVKAVIDEMVEKGELVYRGGIRYDYAYQSENYGRTYYNPEFRSAPKSQEGLRDFFEVEREATSEDELRKRALKLCIERNSASISLLQRCLPVGYLRAGKIIDWMETMGYISPVNGIAPRKVLITEEEYEKIYGIPEIFIDEDDEDDDDYDEDPFEALEEFQQAAFKLIEETERNRKVEAIRLADVVKKIAKKKASAPPPPPKRFEADVVPAHPSWTNEFEFIRTVRKNIEIIVQSDRQMGIKGAIKKARELHWEFNDRGNHKMEEVFERVIFEFEHTSPYEYKKLKKKYFI